eukprot:8152498-Pyramimonas_sp.AAC.1
MLGGGNAHRPWGLRWSSLWGQETRDGCADIGGMWAPPPVGVFGGARYVATKRVKGVPKWVARTHVDTGL